MELGAKARGIGAGGSSTGIRSLAQAPAAIVFRIGLLWLIGWFFFVFHGLSFHLTPWSQAVVNAIVKIVYPTSGQQQTTVLLFREENLRDLNAYYPVPLAIHSQVIDALASYQPKSLFIDFAFVDQPRPGDDVNDMREKLCALTTSREDGTRVFLASARSIKQERSSPSESGTSVEEALLCESCCAKPASPRIDEPYGVSGVLTYPTGVNQENEFLPSAAFAMAKEELGFEPKDQKKLEIIWGKGIWGKNREWMKCEEASPWRTIWQALSKDPLTEKLRCPYTRTLSVNHLLNSSGDKDVFAAINNKAVFYGAGFRFTGDRIDSPVYQEMPGVYLHAMAYDNLVTFGRDDYKVASREGLRARVFDGALLFLAVFLLIFMPREHPGNATRRELVRKIAYPFFIGAAFVVGTLFGGIDAGVLLFLLAFIGYRAFVVKDRGFVVQAAVTLASAVFAYFVLDLGPRNILGFLVFFEVVRHVQEWLRRKAEEYFALRPEGDSKSWRAADWVFGLYLPQQQQEDAYESKTLEPRA